MPSQSSDAGGVATRYAGALYELAETAGALDAVADDLRSFRTLVGESADLARLVASPVLGRDEQARAVAAVAEKAGLDPLTVKFLGTLAQNRRLWAVDDIIKAFLAELARRRGELTAEVTTAQALKPAHLDAVRAALSKALGSKISLEAKVDRALLGGMIVRVGSKMFDSSLATKLQRLKLSMKGIG